MPEPVLDMVTCYHRLAPQPTSCYTVNMSVNIVVNCPPPILGISKETQDVVTQVAQTLDEQHVGTWVCVENFGALGVTRPKFVKALETMCTRSGAKVQSKSSSMGVHFRYVIAAKSISSTQAPKTQQDTTGNKDTLFAERPKVDTSYRLSGILDEDDDVEVYDGVTLKMIMGQMEEK